MPPLWAQLPPPSTQAYYDYNVNASLTSAGVWTVQQPSTVTKTASFVGMTITSTVPLTFTLERDGTAASTTAGTVTQINPSNAASTMNVYSASNVGTGTVMGTYSVQAGVPFSLDLSPQILWKQQTGRNLTVRTSSVTASVQLVVLWSEQ